MGLRRFDRKFGRDFLRELPEAPAVYLFKDETGGVLYVGKAKNVRRRLAQYRNASRRKAHRKMRELVREAHALEVRPLDSETDALLVENELIREHRPDYNVEGAYEFLYPAIGTGGDGDRLWLCITSRVEPFEPLGLRWHGCFRPRWRAREAFDALVSLCGWIGHLEPKRRLPERPIVRGTRFVGVRRIDTSLLAPIRDLLDGESDAVLSLFFDTLLERAAARQRREDVQRALDALAAFYDQDTRRLRDARERADWPHTFVDQAERDALFIRNRQHAQR